MNLDLVFLRLFLFTCLHVNLIGVKVLCCSAHVIDAKQDITVYIYIFFFSFFLETKLNREHTKKQFNTVIKLNLQSAKHYNFQISTILIESEATTGYISNIIFLVSWLVNL